MLKGTLKKINIDNHFKGFGSFYAADKNKFDLLIVCEAHLLIESHIYSTTLKKIKKESMNKVRYSIFLSTRLKSKMKDIGSIVLIEKISEI